MAWAIVGIMLAAISARVCAPWASTTSVEDAWMSTNVREILVIPANSAEIHVVATRVLVEGKLSEIVSVLVDSAKLRFIVGLWMAETADAMT